MAFERRIQTRYDASTTGFDRGTRRVEQGLARLQRSAGNNLRAFDQRIARSVTSVKALASAVTGFAAVQAFRGFLSESRAVVQRLDEIGKTADTIGLTTDQLQGLRAVAKDAGTDVGALDKAMLTFTRRLGQFREGLGAGKAAFEQLGISAFRADGSLKSNYEVLLEVSDALSRVEDQTTRAAIAADLFDKRNARLVLTLASGSRAIEQGIDDAKEMGRVYREDLIRASEDTETQLGRLEDQIDVHLANAFGTTQPLLIAWTRLVEGLAAAADAAAGSVSGLNLNMNEYLQLAAGAPGLIQLITGRGAAAVLGAVDPSKPGETSGPTPLQRVEARRRANAARLRQLRDEGRAGGIEGVAMERAVQADLALEARLRAADAEADPRTGYPPMPSIPLPSTVAPSDAPIPASRPGGRAGGGGGGRSAAAEARDAYAELIATAGERQQQLRDEIALTRLFGEEQAFLAEQQRLLADARRNGVELTDARLAQIDAEARATAELAGELDALDAARRLVEETTEDLLTREEKLARARADLTRLLPQIIQLTGDEARAQEILARAIENTERRIDRADPVGELVDGLASAVQGAQSFEEALNNVLIKFLELAATDFFKALGGSRDLSPLGDLIGAGISAISGIFSPSLTADPFPGVSGRAAGGPVRRGVPYVVGERRPELFVPDQDGTIVPRVPGAVEMPQLEPRGAPTINIGDTVLNVTQPGVTHSELERILADHRRRTIREAVQGVVEMNKRDPTKLYT